MPPLPTITIYGTAFSTTLCLALIFNPACIENTIFEWSELDGRSGGFWFLVFWITFFLGCLVRDLLHLTSRFAWTKPVEIYPDNADESTAEAASMRQKLLLIYPLFLAGGLAALYFGLLVDPNCHHPTQNVAQQLGFQ